MAWFTRLTLGFIAVVTILPLLPVGAWWIRLCDFPRMQIAAGLVLPLLGLTIWSRHSAWGGEQWCVVLLCGLLAAWQLSHTAPYLPWWSKELPDASSTAADLHTVSVVNLKFENEKKGEVLGQLQQLDSDLLLLIEVDQAWMEGLTPLTESYPHRVGKVLEEGLGLLLWSKLPLIEPEVRYLVSDDRPSIFARFELSDGQQVHFVGVHPTPPGLWNDAEDERHDSRIRDAELLLIADRVAKHPKRNWLIVGDFNDVAWSHTTRLFQRLSGLKDPRVGRGLYNSYHAQYPPFRFPIDQVFLSPNARIAQLQRLSTAGSDHFAITTTFTFQGRQAAKPEPEGNDREQAQEMIQEGIRDAQSTNE
ncbi:MAG: endonuclease/exonuclease/phosphatase family protein [Planctomycetales bacterium]|nr:endonuclease/exonuclease/phosphatase family protein [Planctomycetales bacterium]